MTVRDFKPKVSVIVPVYNAGAYLSRCIESLLSQSLYEIEIILVTDCPTDGSDKIAERYAENDARVRIIRNERNMNISMSRNRGLDIACGEYVGFADHDDYCMENMYESLYHAASSNSADVALSNVCEECDGRVTEFESPAGTDGKVTSESMLRSLVSGKSSPIWNQIFRREALKNLRFSDHVSFEDALFNIRFYLNSPKAVYVNKAFYVHVIHGGNAFLSYDYRTFDMTRNYLIEVLAAIRDKGLSDKFAKELAEGTFRRLYSSVLNERRRNGFVSMIRLCSRIKRDTDLMRAVEAHKNFPEIRQGYSIPKKLFLSWLV